MTNLVSVNCHMLSSRKPLKVLDGVVQGVSVNVMHNETFLDGLIRRFPYGNSTSLPSIRFCHLDVDSWLSRHVYSYPLSANWNNRSRSVAWFKFRIRRQMNTLQVLVPGLVAFLECIGRAQSLSEFIPNHVRLRPSQPGFRVPGSAALLRAKSGRFSSVLTNAKRFAANLTLKVYHAVSIAPRWHAVNRYCIEQQEKWATIARERCAAEDQGSDVVSYRAGQIPMFAKAVKQ